MTLTLNDNERKLIRGIKHAIDSRGRDWTYPKRDNFDVDATNDWYDDGVCVNRKLNGEAACIVGFAAIDAGLSIDRLGSVVEYFRRWGFQDGTPLVMALREAQSKQDAGENWGDVFDSFEGFLIANGVVTREELDAIYAERSLTAEIIAKALAIVNAPAMMPVKPTTNPDEVLAALDFQPACELVTLPS